MQLELHNKRWKLVRVQYLRDRGSCDPPDQKGKVIKIRATLTGEEELEVLIHEMLHASGWNLAEEWVAQTAEDIARNLTKLGYGLSSSARPESATKATKT